MVTSFTETAFYNTLLKMEIKIAVTERRERRRKQLVDVHKERRGYKLKQGALVRTLWRTRFGRVYGSVIRQTTR